MRHIDFSCKCRHCRQGLLITPTKQNEVIWVGSTNLLWRQCCADDVIQNLTGDLRLDYFKDGVALLALEA